MKILFQLFVFTLFIFTSLISGQLLRASTNSNYAQLKFSHLTHEDGLPHNNVECILKDSDGFIWIGTRNGLCRYDGYQIKTYTHSPIDSNSLSGNRILSMADDGQGNLWIGTYNNGLNKLNKKTGQFTRFADLPAGKNINKIKIFNDKSIWICTDAGIVALNNENDIIEQYYHDHQKTNSLNSNTVYDIIETREGEIFIGTESNHIQRFNRKEKVFTDVQYERVPYLSTNFKKTILEDTDGVLWISANVHGLCSYNPSNGESEIYTQENSGLSTNVLMGSMVLDAQENIWISTDDDGINIFNPETKEFFYIESTDAPWSLASNHVYSIYFDNQNIAWIGTFDEGVCYFDPGRFKFNPTLNQTNDLKFFEGKSVISLYQDTKQRIWVGTDGDGLYRIDQSGGIKEYRHTPGDLNTISTDVITSIGEDTDGNILLGTYSGGFMVLNPSDDKIDLYYQGNIDYNELGSNSVWNIFKDSQNRIWLGLLGTGVDKFDPESRSFKNFGPSSDSDQKIDFPNVMTITESAEGDIWFGTEGRGIYILDKQTGKVRQLPSDSSQNISIQGMIKCMYEDKWGQMWIGTEGGGLFVYQQKTKEFSNINTDNGLASNIIESIIEDGLGNLWMGTSNGLSVYNPNTKKITNYIKADGLSGNKFNQNVLIKLSDGRLVAGTTDGMDVFQPEQIKSNLILPKIVFTGLKVLNQDVKPMQKINNRVILVKNINYNHEIVLSFKEKTFSISFAALNYTLPEKCQYAYKLTGFDEDWIYTDAFNRNASYTNLPAGTYMFEVKASNNDGKWGNNIKQLQIKILPPFYRTLWFKGILVVLMVILIYSGYRYRLNSIRSSFLEKQFKQEKRIIQLENEKLDSELQKLTFHVLNRNRELIDQKNRLLGLSMKAKESVRIGLQDIIAKLDEELSDDKDWKYIEPQLDKVYNNFVSRLKEKHPDLNLSEIKIAAYVRMNLSTKEISEFMHKTTRAIENDRYRLRKKIGIETNDSLKDYLNNL